ncbi:MAG: DUF4258 domain-containing protein [Chlamydiales bacterium]|nr:DUF4258 domain-containing protein [Chlamydiales bacterium]
MSSFVSINQESGFIRRAELIGALDGFSSNQVTDLCLRGALLRCEDWDRLSKIASSSAIEHISLTIQRLKGSESTRVELFFSKLSHLKSADLKFLNLQPKMTDIVCQTFENLSKISLCVEKGSKQTLVQLLGCLNTKRLSEFALKTNLIDPKICLEATKLLESSIIELFGLNVKHWTNDGLARVSTAMRSANSLRSLEITGTRFHLINQKYIDQFEEAILNSISLVDMVAHPNLICHRTYTTLKNKLGKLEIVGTYKTPPGKSSQFYPNYSVEGHSFQDRLTKTQLRKFNGFSCLTQHAMERMRERELNLKDVLSAIRNGVIRKSESNTVSVLDLTSNIEVVINPFKGRVITVMKI